MTVAELIENIEKLPRFPQDLLDFGQFDRAQAIVIKWP